MNLVTFGGMFDLAKSAIAMMRGSSLNDQTQHQTAMPPPKTRIQIRGFPRKYKEIADFYLHGPILNKLSQS
jgi:hypothetical protein